MSQCINHCKLSLVIVSIINEILPGQNKKGGLVQKKIVKHHFCVNPLKRPLEKNLSSQCSMCITLVLIRKIFSWGGLIGVEGMNRYELS